MKGSHQSNFKWVTRVLIILYGFALLSGCGFQIRGSGKSLVPQSFYLESDQKDPQLLLELVSQIPNIHNITDVKQRANWIIELKTIQEQSQISATDSAGLIREFKFSKNIRWALKDKNDRYVIAPEILNSEQYLNYLDSQILSYEYEQESMNAYLAQKMAARIHNRINRWLLDQPSLTQFDSDKPATSQ